MIEFYQAGTSRLFIVPGVRFIETRPALQQLQTFDVM
jgi:hypothetical protein